MTKFRFTHSCVIAGRRHIWDVERIWALAAELPVTTVSLTAILEIDKDCWFGSDAPTIRAVADHCRRIMDADLTRPIIFDADGSLMDGGHRIARALLEGKDSLPAVRFRTSPEPDTIEDVQAGTG
jgi:hypothetical protein